MKIIKVKTQRGLELKGAMRESASKDCVVILISGICSNVFQNDLLTETGELLSSHNIAYIIGHTMDAFSCIGYSDLSVNKQIYTGTVYDNFSIVYDDVESYVKYAKELGFKKIILAGHSLGSNKIIHYLANTPDDFIDYFIASAPVDLSHWFNVMPDAKKCVDLAKKYVLKNRGKDILPIMFGGFTPMCAESVLSLYYADNLKNCPVISGEGEVDSLYNIKINGSFIIGEKDSLTGGNSEKFIKKINSFCKKPENNRLIVIPDASHIFWEKHKEYSQAVYNCIKQAIPCLAA